MFIKHINPVSFSVAEPGETLLDVLGCDEVPEELWTKPPCTAYFK